MESIDFEEHGVSIDVGITVDELIEEYGKEKVVRGIGYILSLDEAERKYIESMNDEGAEELFSSVTGRNVSMEEIENEASEEVDEALRKWMKEGQEKGIGVDDE
jgi:predicted RNA-binding protein with PUA domain